MASLSSSVSGEGRGQSTLAVSLPVGGVPLDENPAFVQEATEWGYTAAWGSEVAGPDFASLLGAVAITAPVDLGVAVAPVQTRSPWLLAATAASLAHLSKGRFSLGLGTSSEVIIEQWSGQPFTRPLAQLRETVEVVRSILAGERVNQEGAFIRTHGYRLFPPPPGPVPILVGALNPRSLRQAGEIGDGVCLNQLAPSHLRQVLDEVQAGARSAARDLATFPVVARIFCLATDGVAAAREGVRRVFAPYAATSVYNRFFRWLGYADEMDGVLQAFAAGDRAAAAAALSDRFIDDLYVIGDDDHVAAKVREYLDAGVTTAAIAYLGNDRKEALRTHQAAARALAA